MQKFGRCQKLSQISPGPEFSLFIKGILKNVLVMGVFIKSCWKGQVRKAAIGESIILCSDNTEEAGVLGVIGELGYLAVTMGPRSLSLES